MAETGPAAETGSMAETVAVVGLGYVGLPLAVAFDDVGDDVVGFDVDDERVDALAAGADPTDEVGDHAVAAGDVHYATDPVHLSDADYVVVTVPTPVDDLGNPNLGAVEAAARTVGEHLSPGTTVVLESTVYPGATREVLVPALEAGADLERGEDFHVGYSPERLAPGTDRGLRDAVKIVGADDPAVREDLATLYESVVDAGVHRADSLEVAETAKVIENVQRDINIALINELAIICSRLDVDTEAVLEAAGTKWNFHEYEPGLVGGHCIPVDPHYLAYRSECEGFSPKLLLTGREINKRMPKYAAERTVKGLNECGKVLQDCELLVLGLAYKPDVGDIRTSAVGGMIAELETYGISVTGFDPHADDDAMREEFGIEIAPEIDAAGYDGVVVATGHGAFADLELDGLARQLDADPLLMDVDGVFEADRADARGFTYRRL
jgi:UDP-N-acetyl-D-galactosamine dehydrogenase